jgi:hypothetical protein
MDEEDVAAQERLRQRYPVTSLFGDSGTGRDYRIDPPTPEEQAANRAAFSSFIFGPERRSVLPGADEASRPERFIRDWGASEQEFRLSGQRFSEGNVRSGFGWGMLGLAGAIPFAGDIAQGVGKVVRGVGGAADVGRGAGEVADVARAAGEVSDVARTIPEGRWVENSNAEEVPVDFLRQFAEFDRGAKPLGTNIDDLAREITERGFDDALILEVDPSGRALLIEGNHRLEAALRLGLDNVPVRIVTSRPGRLADSGVAVDVAEGLRSGNLLKPSDVFSQETIGRVAGDAQQAQRSIDRLRSAARFDPEEATYGSMIMDDLFEPQVPRTVYHVAPRSARTNIETGGLDPSSATWNTGAGQGDMWYEEALWQRLGDQGEMIPTEYRPEGIYLFDDLEAARQYARNGGDIYEVDLARIAEDGGPVIRDPSVAGNWDYVDDFDRAYVTRVVPEGYFRRVDEIEGEGLETAIQAARKPAVESLVPVQILSSGKRVPDYTYPQNTVNQLNDFQNMPMTIPEFGRLNKQWMDVQDDVLASYQGYLLGPEAQIVDELGALSHWQYVGNENIQSILRTGQMPALDSYERAVRDLSGSYSIPRDQVQAILRTRAEQAMPLLDDLIANSSSHGGFISYRGVDRASIDAAFGDDFYSTLATNPEDLIGLSWTDDAFSATSLSPRRAREFAIGERPRPDTMGVLFAIEVPNGVGAAPVNGYLNMFTPAFSNEFEMLLGRGTTFRITDVVTPADQFELINPKWNNMQWNASEGVWDQLRTDAIPIVYVEVVP